MPTVIQACCREQTPSRETGYIRLPKISDVLGYEIRQSLNGASTNEVWPFRLPPHDLWMGCLPELPPRLEQGGAWPLTAQVR